MLTNFFTNHLPSIAPKRVGRGWGWVFLLLLASCQAHFPSVTPDEYERLMHQSGVVSLDVRHPEEFSEGHIPGARNIDVQQKGFVREVKKQIPRDQTVLVNCKGGVRSKKAATKLTRRGYNVVDLDKGYKQWTEEKKPVEK